MKLHPMRPQFAIHLSCSDTSSEEKRHHIKKSNRHSITASGDRKDQVSNNNQTAAALIPEGSPSKNVSTTSPQESVQNKTESPIIDDTVDTGLANQTLAAAVASPANETSLGSAAPALNNTFADQPIAVANNNTVSESESPSNDTAPAITTMVADQPAINETANNLQEIENAQNVTVTSNCTTPECACQKSCYPKLVASVSVQLFFKIKLVFLLYRSESKKYTSRIFVGQVEISFF